MKLSLNSLEIDNVSHERNQEILFTNLHETLNSGQLLQVQGTNGSGKSTLLRILAGLIEPAAGTVFWNKRCIFQQADIFQGNFHYLGHQNGNKLALTVEENLHLAAALNKHRIETPLLRHILSKLGLANTARLLTLKLSAGQSRRLALAKLLLQQRPLWILDEPSTALDQEGHALLYEILQEHLHKGGMAVIVTHQPFDVFPNAKTLRLGTLSK